MSRHALPYGEIAVGDAVEWAKAYDGEPFHALLCDPPYELGFMGKRWDKSGIAFRPETWDAFKRTMHPGAFGMAFASTRGYHRMACAIEDAGFTIHPMVMWVFGSGFPKATRVNTGEWTETGETESLTDIRSGSMHAGRDTSKVYERAKREPAGAAAAFQGHRYGLQAMKPALEPICVFQKPYKGRPVDCIVETGAGALNIDGGRVGADGGGWGGAPSNGYSGGYAPAMKPAAVAVGRWPANLALDECGAAALDAMSGVSVSRIGGRSGTNANPNDWTQANPDRPREGHMDTGGASRFFYTAKADRSERDMGLDAAPMRTRNRVNPGGLENDPKWAPVQAKNDHPTVKPVDLARWLATLLLPPGSYAPRRLLNPFCGSGTEFIGAVMAGWEYVQSIELSPEYAELARRRVMAAQPPLPMEVSL